MITDKALVVLVVLVIMLVVTVAILGWGSAIALLGFLFFGVFLAIDRGDKR